MIGSVASSQAKKWILPQGILRLKTGTSHEVVGFYLTTATGDIEIPLTDVVNEAGPLPSNAQQLLKLLEVSSFNLTSYREDAGTSGYMLHVQPKLKGAGNTIDVARNPEKLWLGGHMPIVVDCNSFGNARQDLKAILDGVNEIATQTTFTFEVYLKNLDPRHLGNPHILMPYLDSKRLTVAYSDGAGFCLSDPVSKTTRMLDSEPRYTTAVLFQKYTPDCAASAERETKSDCNVCQSYVGRQQQEQQLISCKLGASFSKAAVTHEVCHAIGLEHEQMRADRGDYVAVSRFFSASDPNYGLNVKEGEFGEYDFLSIMHYPFSTTKMQITEAGLQFFQNKHPAMYQKFQQYSGRDKFERFHNGYMAYWTGNSRLSNGDINALNYLAQAGRDLEQQKAAAAKAALAAAARQSWFVSGTTQSSSYLAAGVPAEVKAELRQDLRRAPARLPKNLQELSPGDAKYVQDADRHRSASKRNKQVQNWRERLDAALTCLGSLKSVRKGESDLREIVARLVALDKRNRTNSRGRVGLKEEDYQVWQRASQELQKLEAARIRSITPTVIYDAQDKVPLQNYYGGRVLAAPVGRGATYDHVQRDSVTAGGRYVFLPSPSPEQSDAGAGAAAWSKQEFEGFDDSDDNGDSYENTPRAYRG